MVKALLFKGDKRPKKRKIADLGAYNGTSEAGAMAAQPITKDTPHEDDSWVSAEASTDLSGPVIIVLPSPTPSCIACDANGKVFASELENLVESNAASAEPHDVRQVWIANRIVGTEEVSFKGHHGNYLSSDNIGVLSAKREAISPEESFRCIPSPDIPGIFGIQSIRDTFLSLVEDTKQPEIRGDAETVSFNTGVRIRMQARFKPKLKASKEQKTKERISRQELEEAVGRRLEDDEVRKLKKARMNGSYHETLLDVRVRGKHDKYS